VKVVETGQSASVYLVASLDVVASPLQFEGARAPNLSRACTFVITDSPCRKDAWNVGYRGAI